MPDVKLDSIAYIILFLIPGFIFQSVVDRYTTSRKREGNEKIIGILTASAFLHAIAVPALVWVHPEDKWGLGVGLVVALLVWPMIAGLGCGLVFDSRYGEWLRRRLKANPRGSTGWSYFFGKREAVVVRAILDDGSFIAGAYFDDSCNSGPGTEDLYLEQQYETGANGSIGKLVERTRGCWIPAARLRCLEFFDPRPKESAIDKQDGSDKTPAAEESNR